MSDQNRTSRHSISRRTMLAATIGTTMTAMAGCSQLTTALGGLPSCNGKQRSVPLLTIGDTESSVTVSEFIDYACPHCATFAVEVYPTIQRQYIQTGKIKYVHRDYPIPVGEWSLPVANAVRSVQDQTNGEQAIAFSKVMLTEGQKKNNYSMDFIERKASNTEADAGQVRTAAETRPYCKTIRESRQYGTNQGVEGTPTVFVNDQMFEAPTLNELTSAIDAALKNQ